MKISKLILSIILLFMAFIGIGCGELQKDYYEIHMIQVGGEPFYFINPSEGKDTFSQNKFGTGQSQFIYLYEPVEGIDFNYEQFFSNIGQRYIEQNIPNGKYYLVATQEIDNFINQYFFDRDAWQAQAS